MQESILIIDDDEELCSLLVEYLKPEGFTVDTTYSAETGIVMAVEGSYSLVILDLMLPGQLNGFDVLQKIRSSKSMPVLMLSARGEDVDRIIGLDMGADDYLAKPFNPRELLSRIKAILRRFKPLPPEQLTPVGCNKFRIGDIELNSGSRTVSKAGKLIDLTSVEFNILETLMINVGKIISRDELAKNILGRSLSPFDRSVDVHISNLRKKIGIAANESEQIKSIRGAGYVFVHAPE
jgi:two-component system response regulator CpxR